MGFKPDIFPARKSLISYVPGGSRERPLAFCISVERTTRKKCTISGPRFLCTRLLFLEPQLSPPHNYTAIMATSIPLSLSLYVWQIEVLPIIAGRGMGGKS
jgi:hypothetical protein